MPAETASARDIGGLRRSREKARWVESSDAEIARLAERQHGVVCRQQLADLGLGEDAVDHRIAIGRLRVVARGVYAVGRRTLAPAERWMAAVLSSGSNAVLSHRSAAALWGIWDPTQGAVDVTVPRKSRSSRLIRRHHSMLPVDEVTVHEGVPVTVVPRTILDLAARSSIDRVENAIRQAEYRRLYDRLSLVDMIHRYPGRRGVRRLRVALDRIEALPVGHTRSRLEERFLPSLGRSSSSTAGKDTAHARHSERTVPETASCAPRATR